MKTEIELPEPAAGTDFREISGVLKVDDVDHRGTKSTRMVEVRATVSAPREVLDVHADTGIRKTPLKHDEGGPERDPLLTREHDAPPNPDTIMPIPDEGQHGRNRARLETPPVPEPEKTEPAKDEDQSARRRAQAAADLKRKK